MNSGHTFLFHKGFAQFEEGGLSEEKPNTVKDISTLASINQSSIEVGSDDRSISTNALKEILDGNQIHPDINEGDARLKMRDHIIASAKWMESTRTLRKQYGQIFA